MEKIAIWGESIPYNNGASKANDMKMKKSLHPMVPLIQFVMQISKGKFDGNTKYMDSTHYNQEILKGKAKRTYDDIPVLEAYIVPGSERAVLIVPGGGFAYVESDGEGKPIAEKFNKRGISAFVLWYRTSPYKLPAPMLDVQRAVRWIRHHAEQYGINREKIGIVGFSAGGWLTAAHINLTRNAPVNVEGYVQDAVDAEPDHVAFAGLMYPVLSLAAIPCVLMATHRMNEIQTETDRKRIAADMELKNFVKQDAPPQYIGAGTKDNLVLPYTAENYAKALEHAGIIHRLAMVEGAGHSFTRGEKYSYAFNQFLDWVDQVLIELS